MEHRHRLIREMWTAIIVRMVSALERRLEQQAETLHAASFSDVPGLWFSR